MIHDQSRAYCRCDVCEADKQGKPYHNSQPGLNLSQAEAGVPVDELYYRSLRSTMKSRSMMASQRNASRFVPDEQLLSSMKKRDAKDAHDMAASVPVRRRDHIQELIILENKRRIQTEGLLASQRADVATPEAPTPQRDIAVPPSPPAVETPSSTCSAKKDLTATLTSVKNVMELPGAEGRFSRDQLTQLRTIVRNQENKSRQQQETCENSCFHSHRYRNADGASIGDGKGDATPVYAVTSHPYGTGVVFLPFDESTRPKARGVNNDSHTSKAVPNAERKVNGSTPNEFTESMKQFNSTASMWRTSTHQQNEEMERYMNSQKQLRENAKKVYAC
ncbi:hypothetical protein AGDE_08157 [Angomonas deanei]|nr:hypothetical protein AGDE_08157 [Angomonas deanei]|eukprot:EPY33935.1 hypothetical protein AGDE_08157 [Angomonas deanei]